MTYLRPVCLQPDPANGSFDYFACSGGGHWAKHSSEPSSDGGPQESFFTRMGNPHPLQMQHLGQPTTPQLNPIIPQPVSAPTALAQQIPMPILPLAHPMADPATAGLHIPTLQAIHRMQQQASPAPTMPTMPQTSTVQPPATLPRDPAEYTQANFPSHTSWFWLSWRCRTSKHCAAAHITSCSLAIRQGQGDLHQVQAWATHSPPAPHHALWRQGKKHSSDFDQSHTQHHEGRDRRAVCPPRTEAGAARGHNTQNPSPSRPSRDQAFILRSRSQLGKLPVPDLQLDEEWMTK